VVGLVVHIVSAEETGAMDREIESRQGIGLQLFKRKRKQNSESF
jgi:hypothetical protein